MSPGPTLAEVLAGSLPDGVHGWSGPETAAELSAVCVRAGWRLAHLAGPTTRAEALDAVATGFGLPAWFGQNLDALDEALADLDPGRWLVVWDDPDTMPAGDRSGLTEVLADATHDRAGREGRLVVLLRSSRWGSGTEVSG